MNEPVAADFYKLLLYDAGSFFVDHRDNERVERWQPGQMPHLERVVQANLSRISEAMKLFRDWARGQGLFASETHYVMRRLGRQTLRFSKSGDPTIEALYRTHWVSTRLSEQKRERLAQKASRAPELVRDLEAQQGE